MERDPFKRNPPCIRKPPIEYTHLLRGGFLNKSQARRRRNFLGYILGENSFLKGKLIILEFQIALKIKENGARGRLKVQKFSGAPSGARNGLKPLILGSLPKVGF